MAGSIHQVVRSIHESNHDRSRPVGVLRSGSRRPPFNSSNSSSIQDKWIESNRMSPAAKSSKQAAKPTSRPPTSTAAVDSRREQRRLVHQDLSRAQLLDAAEEVFGRKGFHEATLKEVADLAEFSVGSVYSFFENKDDLFLNVFVRRGAEFMPGLEAVAAEAGDPREQLHRLVDYEVGFFRSHPHFGRLYLRSASAVMAESEVPSSAMLDDNFRRAMQVQAEVFVRGQAAGRLRSGDPFVLARIFSGMISGYQAVDPNVVSDDGGTERLSLAALHEIVAAAFEVT
jgi:TetR/AcrR family transcriptional regulator